MSSFDSAMQILGLLGRDRKVLRVGEVGRELAMPKSSVSRLLRAMEEAGLLQRDGGGYAAGPRSLTLASLYLERWTLLDQVDPVLEQLVDRFGFTGFVSKLDGSDIVLLRVRQGSYPLRYVREIGTRLPAWQTAMGQVLLARLSDAARTLRLEGCGEIDQAKLSEAIAQARATGSITARSTFTLGATTIATAVGAAVPEGGLALGIAFPDSAADAPLRRQIRDAMLQLGRAFTSGSPVDQRDAERL